MVKFKKTMGIVLAACMTASMAAGCTNTNDTKETTVASKDEETTEAKAEEKETTKAEETKEDAEASADKTTEAETEEQETTKADDNQGGELVFDGYTPEVEGAMELLEKIQNLDAYYGTTELSFNVLNEYDEESEEISGTITIDSAMTADGDSSSSLSGEVNYDGISISGQVLTASYVDGVAYLDIRGAYDIAEKLIGEEYMDQMVTELGTDLASLKKLLLVGVPIEGTDLMMPEEAQDAAKKLSGMVMDDVALAVSAGDFVEEDNGIYSMVINNDNFGEFLYDLLSALDTNIGDIYDAYVEYMEAMNLPGVLQNFSDNYVDKLIEYVEKITGETVTDEQRAELEKELEEEIETYLEEYEDMLTSMKEGKDDFMSEWDDLIADMRSEGYEGVKESLEEEGTTIDGTVSIGEKNDSYVMAGNISVVEDNEYYKNSTSIGFKSTIDPDKYAEVNAPDGATSFEEALDVVADIYKIYVEQVQGYYETSREAVRQQESLEAEQQAEIESAQQELNN